MVEQTRQVRTIPATRTRFTAQPVAEKKKRRAAAYARVSTDSDEQYTSYEAQIDYYTDYIKSREDWEFVDVYTDEGITGTSTKHREGFKQMVADALGGKIDLIVTKSVSRFARNTVDSLTTIRQLKEKGIECYFEKENIWTFDGKGELLITIMSSLAQEESRSISENCTWGQRKRMQDGKVSVPFSRFLGYDRGADGKLVVNPEQAEIVRLIFSMFLQGVTPHGIAANLTSNGIKTPTGKDKWCSGTVRAILGNEKYKGDALLQKCFTEDFLTKKQIRNVGQLPQYYVSGDHEAIIAPDVFDMVQRELAKRKPGESRYSGVKVFSSTVFCGECGGMYGSKVWHSNDKYRHVVWRCNRKYASGKQCATPHFSDEELEAIFISALNKLSVNRDEIKAAFETVQQAVFDTSDLERELTAERERLDIATERLEHLVRENASVTLDQAAYNIRFENLSAEYDRVKAKCDELESNIRDKMSRKAEVGEFITELLKQPDLTTEFDPVAYRILVDRITIYAKEKVVVRFKDGTEITA